MPQLPTELWLEILRHATEVPGAFDTSYKSPVDQPSSSQACARFQSAHSRSMITKRNIVAVSRELHAYGTSFLYETISLRNDHELDLLAQTLEKNPFLGQHVKRFELGTIGKLDNFSRDSQTSLCIALKRCPNLIICILELDRSSLRESDTLLPLSLCPRPSLRWLTYRNETFNVPYDILHSTLIPFAPNLEILRIAYMIPVDRPTARGQDVSFPRLHTFSLDGSYAVVGLIQTKATWHMPHLKHVTDVSRYARWLPFLDAPSVTALTVNFIPDDLVLEGCPEAVDMTCTGLGIPFPLNTPMPFQRVGISTHIPLEGKLIPTALDHLVNILIMLSSKTRYPHLAIVRFIDLPTEFWIQFSDMKGFWLFWTYWDRMFRSQGVRLEDGDHAPVSLHLDSFESDQFSLEEYRRRWHPSAPDYEQTSDEVPPDN